jgi:outer membrane cobalamin receptor
MAPFRFLRFNGFHGFHRFNGRSLAEAAGVGGFVAAILLLIASAASAGDLRGRVLDPQDRPVVAADVMVLRGALVIGSARTGADGRFGPLALPDGDYAVVVAAPGLRAAPLAITVKSPAPNEIDVRLTLAAISESIVVSAAQVDTSLARATDSVTVMTAADLEARQIRTVADAVRDVPGFGVISSGGRGALTSFFPRGGESDYTLVLVDGIPQNTFGGAFDAAHLSTADVDRLEIVRGPQSALFGSGAIGGIVHVITRQGGPSRAFGLIEGGAYGTWRTSVSFAGSRRQWTWGGSIDKLSTDGNTAVRPNLGGPVSNDDYDSTRGSASLGWSDRPSRRVRVDVRGGRDERGFPGPYGSDPLHRFFGLDTKTRGRNTSIQLGASALLAGTGAIRHHAHFTFANLRGNYLGSFPSTDRTRRVTGRYQIDFTRRLVDVSGGWEGVQERADNTYVTGTTFQEVPIRRFISGLFVEARPNTGARLFVTTGVRLDYIKRQPLEDSPGTRPTFDADAVWSVNPKIAVAWVLGSTKIRFGAATGIKPPTTFDTAFTDNPNLKPERSRSMDIGVEQALAGSALVADVTWFANRYDDLIVAVRNVLAGASRYKSDNIANARARGLELGLSWRSKTGLSARAAWTLLDTEILGVDGLPGAAPSPYAVGDQLIRRPRQQGSLDLTWVTTRGTGFVKLNGRGVMADLEPNFGTPVLESRGFVTTTIGGSVCVSRNIDVIARVSNLFNRSYEEALGFPALGRAASVGVRVTAGR